MIKNYIVSATRNITKNKFYAFLNIIGLTIGFAAFIFLFLYLRDELAFDVARVKSYGVVSLWLFRNDLKSSWDSRLAGIKCIQQKEDRARHSFDHGAISSLI